MKEIINYLGYPEKISICLEGMRMSGNPFLKDRL